MEILFHPAALAEFKAATSHYETVQPSLGSEYADEVLRVAELAHVFPRLGSPEDEGVRCLLTKRFPYVVYYEVIGDVLWIWAVMHTAREPGYWKGRNYLGT